MSIDLSGGADLSGTVRRFGILLFAVLLIAALLPLDAMALNVSSARSNNLRAADLTVSLTSSDPTGTVIFAVDGVVRDVRQMTPGEAVTHSKVALRDGLHRAAASIRSRDVLTAVESAQFRVWSKPAPARLVTPTAYAARFTQTVVDIGTSTTHLTVNVNGKRFYSGGAAPGTRVSLGRIELRQGANSIELVAANPVTTTVSRYTVQRLDFPWPTCIIVDKSEYALYWVKNGVLVKKYPVAIGKAHTPTPSAIWRIDAKYYTDPGGVYGPRKMRLFRQTSSGYVYTAYGIHGTNQPWVIGTKASHGCIRMYNRDVLELFPQVPLGTMVQTRE